MEMRVDTPLTSINVLASIPFHLPKTSIKLPFTSSSFNILATSSSSTIITPSSSSSSSAITAASACSSENLQWMIIMDKPPENVMLSKPQLIDYYVTTLQTALSSDEKDAQRCIYHASFNNTHFGFCCFAHHHTSNLLAGMPAVLSVKPDLYVNSVNKDYSHSVNLGENSTALLFPYGSKNWVVTVEKPSNRVVSKAQTVDYYVDILAKILGNERVAQMCLYHASWQSDYCFCCILDEGCAEELAAMPEVLSIKPDENFNSRNEYVGGSGLMSDAVNTAGTDTSKTKLFITGLSFYTSEKTLRAAFEPFGKLLEVKIIMDKISKRSKGFAFVDYATEDAATTALEEMNGKIINGWMIVVDRARSKARMSKSP